MLIGMVLFCFFCFFVFCFCFCFFLFLFLLICFVMICIPLPFRVLLIWRFLKLKSWNRIICYFLEMMSRLEGPLKQGKTNNINFYHSQQRTDIMKNSGKLRRFWKITLHRRCCTCSQIHSHSLLIAMGISVQILQNRQEILV